jgi:hypothetical protein
MAEREEEPEGILTSVKWNWHPLNGTYFKPHYGTAVAGRKLPSVDFGPR